MPLTQNLNLTTLDKVPSGVRTDMTFSSKRTSSAYFFHHLPRSRRNGGFSLTELLIVLVIAAILMVVAVPSFKTMSRTMAVRGAADELVGGIHLARSEAIRTNRTVSLSIDGRTWQIFTDTNKDHVFNSGEELLREGSYPELIAPQTPMLWFNFAPDGTTTSLKSFPTSICLATADSPPIQRQVLFPARASSPEIQTTCD